ncbi:Mitochondrial Carrier (MC) Family [Phytophthora infestans T30-4]|uniref:Mitochondrial Carrier (MC) Family n=1 Tax=Phytophthora infestans (strain T30-4) TaxID=403677 RepID=D0NHP6_PHYIT|nr:Mitochondrial Carrier (MC) Family [Phytophthora infestans T30-4]EEY58971.1 Mitochondrial Carrier (MC) Family [Phytophthora infestans T30-4]|eukprot:XP_002901444.1 Mitochondrial Carrier (MC) Family [Phytophthora infestans T30-4]
MSERAERLSGLQNGAVGSIAGMAEVMLQQPTVAIKNAMQQGRPITWTVPALYRGLGVSLASIAPISAIQFAANGRLLRGLTAPKEAPSDRTKLLCATLSVKEVAQQHGVVRLLRGVTVTAVRDSMWCAGYLALGPVLTREMHTLRPTSFGDADTATAAQKALASVAGCVTAGLLSVAATQPLDTVKTVMQGEAMILPSGRAPSTLATVVRIYRKGGLLSFYRGILPRGYRLAGAVLILNQSRIWLEEVFEDHELLKF